MSASLINAYTVSFDNLQQTSVSLINTYHDGVRWNNGKRVPTLIKIEGKLTLSEYVNLQYPDKMRVYLPSTSIALGNFIVNNDQMGCSYFCRLNKSLTTTVSENWLEMNSVVVENMPTLTNDFKVLLPVELTTNLLSIYIGFEVRGRLISVYRFGGSAVKSLITGPPPHIFTTQTNRVVPWDIVSDWITSPLLITDYKQCINL